VKSFEVFQYQGAVKVCFQLTTTGVHMSAFIRIVSIAIVAFGATSSLAFALTTINFDDVADQTDIRTHYQPQGVTFSCEGAACSNPAIANAIYARATTPTASVPNSVSPIGTGFPGVKDSLTGRVAANFSSPVKTVSVDARAVLVPEPLNQLAYANIIAYDAAGAVVASTTGSALNAFQTLTVAAADNRIVKVTLGVTGNVAVATFDNLQFDRDASLIWVIYPIFFIILIAVYWFYKSKKDLPRPPSTH
jgi:hypothetical protein